MSAEHSALIPSPSSGPPRLPPGWGSSPPRPAPCFPSCLLVVGRFNVCDWNLLEFLSCPPQRALLSWNWRVNAAITRNIYVKLLIIEIHHIVKKKNLIVQTNSMKNSSPLPQPAPEVTSTTAFQPWCCCPVCEHCAYLAVS